MTQPLSKNIFFQYMVPQDTIDNVDRIKPKSYSEQVNESKNHTIINPIIPKINQSLQTGIVPGKIKIAKVMPICLSQG